MKIRILNYTKECQLSKEEIKEVTNFFLSKLIKKKTLDQITLTINFVPDKIIKHRADLLPTDKFYRPKKFLMRLNSSYKKKMTLKNIAHESVHVKQYATGELTDLRIGNKCRWKGQEFFGHKGPIVDEERLQYRLHPFEIEAYGLENWLYESYLEFKYLN